MPNSIIGPTLAFQRIKTWVSKDPARKNGRPDRVFSADRHVGYIVAPPGTPGRQITCDRPRVGPFTPLGQWAPRGAPAGDM
jgi:hypothetical protein